MEVIFRIRTLVRRYRDFLLSVYCDKENQHFSNCLAMESVVNHRLRLEGRPLFPEVHHIVNECQIEWLDFNWLVNAYMYPCDPSNWRGEPKTQYNYMVWHQKR